MDGVDDGRPIVPQPPGGDEDICHREKTRVRPTINDEFIDRHRAIVLKQLSDQDQHQYEGQGPVREQFGSGKTSTGPMSGNPSVDVEVQWSSFQGMKSVMTNDTYRLKSGLYSTGNLAVRGTRLQMIIGIVKHQAWLTLNGLFCCVGATTLYALLTLGAGWIEKQLVGTSSFTMKQGGVTNSQFYVDTFRGVDLALTVCGMIISMFSVKFWFLDFSLKFHIADIGLQLVSFALFSFLVFQFTGDLKLGKIMGVWLCAQCIGHLTRVSLLSKSICSKQWVRKARRILIWGWLYSTALWSASFYPVVAAAVRQYQALEILLLSFTFPLIQWLVRREFAKSMTHWVKRNGQKQRGGGLTLLALCYASVEGFSAAPGFYVMLIVPSELTFYSSLFVSFCIECLEVLLYLKGRKVILSKIAPANSQFDRHSLVSLEEDACAVAITFREQGEKMALFLALVLLTAFRRMELSIIRIVASLFLECMSGVVKELLTGLMLNLSPAKLDLYMAKIQIFAIMLICMLAFSVISCGESLTIYFVET